MNHRVEICTPEEAERYIARYAGVEHLLRGHVDVICREADGSVAWEAHQPNIITDHGRRKFVSDAWPSASVFTSPSLEAAALGRFSLLDDGAATSSQVSIGTTATYDAVTYTKTWSPVTAFAAPAAARQIGTVGLAGATAVASGMSRIYAYTVVSPAKTQGTTQTLEVVYKITLTPIY